MKRLILRKAVIKKSGCIVAMEQQLMGGGGSRDFGNDFARNVVLLGVDFSTS